MKCFILKNQHYSNLCLHFGLVKKKILHRYEVKFNSNCLYQITDSDKLDINKLTGITTDWSSSSFQSFRFGWRCIDGKNIQILPFTHVEGNWNKEEIVLAEVEPNVTFCCEIYINEKEVVYSCKGKDHKVELKTNPYSKSLWWKNFPYFGGNKTVPHFMSLEVIKDI